MKWYKVTGSLKSGDPFIKKVTAGGKSVCLVGYEGEIFALSSRCPHAGGDLTMGWCNHKNIICPIHRYSYDLQTGKGSKGQNDYIDTYPVKIIEDVLYIGINSVFDNMIRLFRK